ncbi:sn-glycerol-3-phosphate ABC transporter substrate-binding protein UgpB [Rhodoplanes sp. TEM]|uniref:sn-glycerol-3-phosphate-binding periplasmic protein UgpB n=1 Tax=Rhodoplanes tepidamans TaxID=200616 RepID=A0ABT5JD48_RHOTP|nr:MULTISPECIES: sn-glycerol-3-phosphate ABC transporter substrate-binding protein UgpB [Rhodoplanes]MDC7787204.1 sn-glycerol-3-phosphate ABC transporter substrate-binding protein UgpB [Rhodoplanes tepidamans]MDC7984170.1 sn-glycerol-3-phosphate ABC transporter substrate-binding protein UgpB [Rhodoplanes sp. TEM]
MRSSKRIFGLLIAGLLLAGPLLVVAAATRPARALDIQFWHGMPGELAYPLDDLVAGFNASQPDYRIVPVFKGLYTQTMLAALFATRIGEQPAIVQIAEVGTATMMTRRDAVVEVDALMRQEKAPFDPAAYIPAVAAYYTDGSGKMLSIPFNSSVPILFYNKDKFQAAGLDPEAPPKTWPEVEAAAKRLRGAGQTCGFTTDWPSWINVENFSAVHGLPVATRGNGFDGLDAELALDNPLMLRHLEALVAWQRAGLYAYGGRATKAEAKFLGRECPIFLGSSASRAEMLNNATFKVGFGPLPYWPDVRGAPHPPLIGGGSLWVLRGRPDAEYAGVAKFFAYLSQPAVQARWHQTTGYLPITRAAYEASRKSGFYGKNPGADIAIRQLGLEPPAAGRKGLRLGSYVVIRDIVEEEMEQALAGTKTPAAALTSAVARGNAVLRDFAAQNLSASGAR